MLANTASTQAQITAAAANLNAAIAAYKADLITPIASSSLVAYWKFNGNANDSSGNGHNGTLEAGLSGSLQFRRYPKLNWQIVLEIQTLLIISPAVAI